MTQNLSTFNYRQWRSPLVVLSLLLSAGVSHSQMINYDEQLGAYQNERNADIELTDGTFPAVRARSAVAYSLATHRVVNQSDLELEPDGSVRLPSRRQNLVIRTDYSNIEQGLDGVVRIASPVINGNVSGNVTLYVEGQGVENITVLNKRSR